MPLLKHSHLAYAVPNDEVLTHNYRMSPYIRFCNVSAALQKRELLRKTYHHWNPPDATAPK